MISEIVFNHLDKFTFLMILKAHPLISSSEFRIVLLKSPNNTWFWIQSQKEKSKLSYHLRQHVLFTFLTNEANICRIKIHGYTRDCIFYVEREKLRYAQNITMQAQRTKGNFRLFLSFVKNWSSNSPWKLHVPRQSSTSCTDGTIAQSQEISKE